MSHLHPVPPGSPAISGTHPLGNGLKRRKVKVLIVDDAEADRVLYQHFLRKNQDYDFECIEAETWQSGMECWLNKIPDIVLLDYHLPDGNGLDFLEKAGTLNHFLTLPIRVST